MFDVVIVVVIVVVVDVFRLISLSIICMIRIKEKGTEIASYLSKTKVNENTRFPLIAVEEIVWFHIPMNDPSCMKMAEACQKRTHVTTNVICCHFSVYVLMIESELKIECIVWSLLALNSSCSMYGITTKNSSA